MSLNIKTWNKCIILVFTIFMTLKCGDVVSNKTQKQDNNQAIMFDKDLFLSKLKLIVDTIQIKNSDLSISLNDNHEDVKYLLKSLKDNQVRDELLFYSINNYLLKIFLYHERNGCCGHNMNRQEDNIAEWMVNTAKTQLPYQKEFEIITHSGFIYYAIKENIAKLPYDTLIYKMISLRIDSCLNYDKEIYPKNFRP